MGRRGYITRLALGRSPYEFFSDDYFDKAQAVFATSNPDEFAVADGEGAPEHTENAQVLHPLPYAISCVDGSTYQQLYDWRGHPQNPASRHLERQSRRAMNEVNAAVGICEQVNDNENNSAVDRATVEAVSSENFLGLKVDWLDRAAISITHRATIGFRHRLQTFRFYSGLPMTSILPIERERHGLLGLFFLGTPAGMLLDYIREYPTMDLLEKLPKSDLLNKIHEKKTNLGILRVQVLEIILKVCTFALLMPLQIFAELQGLSLLPAWPWFPHPKALMRFTSSSLRQMQALPASMTFRSAIRYVVSLALSPLFLQWVILRSRTRVRRKLQAYLQAAMPRPLIPDRYSIEAAKQDKLDNDKIPGIDNAPDVDESRRESDSFLREFAKDLQYIGYTYQVLCNRCSNFFGRNSPKVSSNTPRLHPLGIRNHRDNSAAETVPAPIRNPSTIIYPPSTKKTKSLHPPSQRVTALTTYASHSMAYHLSWRLADILYLPIESLFLRSLATNFLSAPRADPIVQDAAARWRGAVFPLGGWAGMGFRGGWKGMVDYAGKMMIVFGLEMGVSYAIWQLCTSFALWKGKRRFRWGKL